MWPIHLGYSRHERPAPREELMDTPTSAAPDEKTPPLELSKSATQENPKPSGQLEISAERFNSSVARLTSNSIQELQGLVCELQKMQEFLKSEVDSVQRQIDSALAGINIIVETIGPWKSLAGSCVDGSVLARAFFTFCSIGRCSHVFGLSVRFT
jgi:hypothetical protein